MALIGNFSAALRSPLRRLGGSAASTETGIRDAFRQTGNMRGRMFQDGSSTADKSQSLPMAGSYPSMAYLMPQTGKWLSSRYDTTAVVTASAAGTPGMPGVGDSALLVTAAATGQLLAAGSGSATITVAPDTCALTASIAGTGTAALAVTTNTPVWAAPASVSGSSSLSVAGTLAPHAKGILSASILPYTDLSPQALAIAVWEQYALESGLTAAEVQRIMLAAMAGKATGGGTASITFRDHADTKDRIVATVDGSGNRSSVTLNGA